MTTEPPSPSPSVDRKPLLLAAGGLLVFLLIALTGILALVRHEESRDLDRWRLTLNVMADSRARQVQGWLDRQFAFLGDLAANGALQVYAQALLAAPARGEAQEPAQLSYLRNLLRVEADRGDFVDRTVSAQTIPANVVPSLGAGLALYNVEGQPLLSAAAGPPPDAALVRQIAAVAEAGKPAVVDLHLDARNRAILGFLVPVFGLAPQTGKEKPIAVLYGFKDAVMELFMLLRSEASAPSSAETLLVRGEGNLLAYLSPLADGTEPLRRRLGREAGNRLAANLALDTPGSFGTGVNYAGRPVLFVSRSLAGVPWLLIQQVVAADALRESSVHGRFLLLALTLSLAAAGALIVAAWWHGSAVRARASAAALAAAAGDLEEKTRILDAVVDNVHDILFLLDPAGALLFVNRPLAGAMGVAADELRGKTLPAVFGPAVAGLFVPYIHQALQCATPLARIVEIDLGEGPRVCAGTFIPVRMTGQQTLLLVTLHDITQIEEARARQEKLLEELVRALMRSIDLHDPWSANHSAMVTDIAVKIAAVMNLPEEDRRTLTLAATLCNVGKLFIPRELLTRTGSLSEEELRTVRTEPGFVRDALAGIEFGGPVLTAILQKNECLDGSGYPDKLREPEIILVSRILAVANVFVALISPRAWRERFLVREALERLHGDAGVKYDRRVVAALFHVAENEIQWSAWQEGRFRD